MNDPAIVPWSIVWIGIILAASGAVLCLHGIGQREPSRVASVGLTAVMLGVACMVAPPLINGGFMLLRSFGDIARQTTAASSENSDAYRQR
jgi:hypothetical protein